MTPLLQDSMHESPVVVTFNPRVILDWSKHDHFGEWPDLFATMRALLYQRMPALCPEHMRVAPSSYDCPTDDPRHRWLTFYLEGSRGFSHELVRHGDFTAISQRSTRYCDESEALFHDHPHLTRALAKSSDEARTEYINGFAEHQYVCRHHYLRTYRLVYDFLIADGIPPSDARKQARGAARLVLPNSVNTSLIFSATLAQWRHIVSMRTHPSADAEISVIMNQVKDQLP